MMLRQISPLLLLVAAACDPCTGVGTCTAPHVRYEGLVYEQPSGSRLPAEGIQVKFVRRGGSALESDTVVTRSDAGGRFRIEARARQEGEVSGDLWIYPPPPVNPFRVEGVRMLTSRAPGDARWLGEWKVLLPYLGHQVFLYYRATGQPATGLEVEFRRTGGIRMEPETLRVPADPRGYAVLRPKPAEHGTVTGDLTIYPLPPYAPITIRDYKLSTFTEERGDSVVRMGIGSRLPYSVFLVWEDSGKGIDGAELEFRRTGGVLISPERFVARTDRSGMVHLNPAPLTSGEVCGDVTIRPPAPGRITTRPDVCLKTYDDDRGHMLLGYWGVRRETS